MTDNSQFICRQMGNRRIKILNYRKEKQPGLLERLTEYAGSDAYPFHMPGHKDGRFRMGSRGDFRTRMGSISRRSMGLTTCIMRKEF